eukprot:6175151-Pleurochrysis_carterae.AAC.1
MVLVAASWPYAALQVTFFAAGPNDKSSHVTPCATTCHRALHGRALKLVSTEKCLIFACCALHGVEAAENILVRTSAHTKGQRHSAWY